MKITSFRCIGLYGLCWLAQFQLQAWDRDRGPIWPDGTVEMYLHLGDSIVYEDGLTPNQVAAAVIAKWNPTMQRVQLVARTNSTVSRGYGNRVSDVTFDKTILGTAFGDGILGVEITDYDSTRRLESDVILNVNVKWDSYDGSLREGVVDLRRVLLHELGHTLGLDHPDEAGQFESAIMNSTVSYLTELQTDDLDGIGALYGYTTANPGRPPFLHSSPKTTTIVEGHHLHLSVDASGAQPMTYQWFKDGSLLPEFTYTSVAIEIVTPAAAGAYHVVVSNVAGTVTTGVAQVTVVKPIAPVIAFPNRHHEHEAVEGQGFGFSLRVLGSEPFTYQWYRNGVPIVGATSSSFGVEGVKGSDAGEYHAVVRNLSGSDSSPVITVTVEPQPLPKFSNVGINAPATLFLEEGRRTELRPPFSDSNAARQWYRDGVPIPNAQSTGLGVSYSDTPTGDYTLVLTNAAGTSTSGVMRVVHGIQDVESFTPVAAVDPTRAGHTFDDVLVDRRGNLILHSRLARHVWIWSVNESRFIATIPLFGGVNELSYSPTWDKILAVYSDGRLTQIPLDGSPRVETVLTRLEQAKVELEPIGELLFIRLAANDGSSSPIGLVLDASGHELSRLGGLAAAKTIAWDPLRRRIFFTNGLSLSYVLYSLHLSAEGVLSDLRYFTYGSEENFAADPLVVSPDGERLIAGTGEIYDGVNLGHLQSLGRDVDAGLWLDSAFITADSTTQGVRLIRWHDRIYSIEAETRVSGLNPRLFRAPDNRIILTTVSKGRFIVSTFDEHLRPLTRVTHLGVDLLSSKAKLSNLSTRVSLSDDGDGLLVAGFVIGGTEPMNLVVRAVGPSLSRFKITNYLADPALTVFGAGGEVVARNDDWTATGPDNLLQLFETLGAFSIQQLSKDAALRVTLPPGAYTAHVARGNQPGGVVLLEIYDASPDGTDAHLVNLSTRMHTGSGDQVLTTGFVVAGDLDRTLLVRAAGPSLARYGVPSLLLNPVLRVQQGANIKAQNDDWSGLPSLVSAAKTVGAFDFDSNSSRDSALLITFPPDAYTTQVTGADENSSGTVLVEIYTTD